MTYPTAFANPTSVLPPLRTQPSAGALLDALFHLATLYASTVRSQLLEHFSTALGSRAEEDEDGGDGSWADALDAARADDTERRYAMTWLTRLMATGAYWVEQEGKGASPDELVDIAGRIVAEEAAVEGELGFLHGFGIGRPRIFGSFLVANYSTPFIVGKVSLTIQFRFSEAGALVREFTFPSSDSIGSQISDSLPSLSRQAVAKSNASPIELSLRDDPLAPGATAEEAAAVGVQTWAAAIVLSEMLAKAPELFHPAMAGAWDAERKLEQRSVPFRIAELGAGTGLVGMVAARLLEQRRIQPSTSPIEGAQNNQQTEVLLTDYHDRVLANLEYNLEQNFSGASTSSKTSSSLNAISVKAAKLDWEAVHSGALDAQSAVPGRFSLLLAADVIYSRDHARWLLSTIAELLARPSEDVSARAHVVIAVRQSGRFEGLIEATDEMFGSPQETYVASTGQYVRSVEETITLPGQEAFDRAATRAARSNAPSEPATTQPPSLSTSMGPTPADTLPGTPVCGPHTSGIVPGALSLEEEEQDRKSGAPKTSNARPKASDPVQLVLLRRTQLPRIRGIGRGDENGYLWYEFGWARA